MAEARAERLDDAVRANAKKVRTADGMIQETPAVKPVTAADHDGALRRQREFPLHVRCIQLESLEEKWDDRDLAIAIRRLFEAASSAPDAPQVGTTDATTDAESTIAELTRWAEKLQHGRIKDRNTYH